MKRELTPETTDVEGLLRTALLLCCEKRAARWKVKYHTKVESLKAPFASDAEPVSIIDKLD